MKTERIHSIWQKGLLVLSVLLSPFTFHLSSLAQDYARVSERSLMGTARYVGLGGAMSAIGGDPSSVMDNSAGLGLYRRMEVMVTFDHTITPATSSSNRTHQFMAPQASIIFSLPLAQASENEGTQYHNFMVSYQRTQTFTRSLCPNALNGRSLGNLFAYADGDMGIPFTTDRYNAYNLMQLEERGYTNEYAFDWATNIANKWYWGLGFRVHSFSFSSEGDYLETFDYQNASGEHYYNRSRTTLLINGAGCGIAAGFIGRPLSWLRLGLGLQTPSVGSLTISTHGTFDALTDSLRWSDAPNRNSRYNDFHMPFHLSASVAFQIKQYAMIALQYDCRCSKNFGPTNSFRTGLEIVPTPGLYLQAGYVFESAFQKAEPVDYDHSLNRQDTYFWHPRWDQYISGGIGFRGRFIIAQAAYQYRMQRAQLFAHELAAPYDINQNSHRIVITIGWHSN